VFSPSRISFNYLPISPSISSPFLQPPRSPHLSSTTSPSYPPSAPPSLFLVSYPSPRSPLKYLAPLLCPYHPRPPLLDPLTRPFFSPCPYLSPPPPHLSPILLSTSLFFNPHPNFPFCSSPPCPLSPVLWPFFLSPPMASLSVPPLLQSRSPLSVSFYITPPLHFVKREQLMDFFPPPPSIRYSHNDPRLLLCTDTLRFTVHVPYSSVLRETRSLAFPFPFQGITENFSSIMLDTFPSKGIHIFFPCPLIYHGIFLSFIEELIPLSILTFSIKVYVFKTLSII